VVWQRGRAAVKTPAGEELAAPRLIVTVPLGVLKAGAIAFSPRLPDKEEAMARLEMGYAERVSLCLGRDAWVTAGRFSEDNFMLTGEPPFPVWWVSRPPPFPVVTGWAGGRNAGALPERSAAERTEGPPVALAAAFDAE